MLNFSIGDYLTKILTNQSHNSELHKLYEQGGVPTEGKLKLPYSITSLQVIVNLNEKFLFIYKTERERERRERGREREKRDSVHQAS